MFDYPIIFLICDGCIIVSATTAVHDNLAYKILEDCGIAEKDKLTIDKELTLKSYLNDPKYYDIVSLIYSYG